MDTLLVLTASLLAGCIDAIAGGGGLVLVPAMFAAYPQAAPAALLGTNKGAAIWGTALAAWRYARRVELRWGSLGPAIGCALAGSGLGAWTLTQIDATRLRIVLPLLLLAVLVYTLWNKNLGQTHAPLWAGRREALLASAIGLGIGFYDGLFGPGTGSFFVFLLVRALGYDFLHASASAKLLNTATNGAALALFASTGHLWWGLAAAMALANMAGSLLGTHLALTRGAAFVRRVFLWVVGALILRTGWDAARLLLA